MLAYRVEAVPEIDPTFTVALVEPCHASISTEHMRVPRHTLQVTSIARDLIPIPVREVASYEEQRPLNDGTTAVTVGDNNADEAHVAVDGVQWVGCVLLVVDDSDAV